MKQAACATEPESDGRILVVIQLDGGNDGINTVVPFRDEGYDRHRHELRLADDRLLKINDELALHPSLRGAADLFEQQRLALVQGVGYPNPNRSHDVSMAIWQSARFDREEQKSYGWIGRALDQAADQSSGFPDSLLIGEGSAPLALWGRRSVASAFETMDDLTSRIDPVPGLDSDQNGHGDLASFLQRQTLDAYSTADSLSNLASGTPGDSRYPGTGFSSRLQLISRLIKADLGTRVYYAVQSGYDTHSTQLPVHSRLMRELAGGLQAFLNDLQDAGLEERVLVICFSEFGRRVAENASAGTDHGTAGPVLLAGGGARPGVHGKTPSLLDLEEGDLKHTVDFRSVYAAVVSDWLGLPSATVLDGEVPVLDLVKTT